MTVRDLLVMPITHSLTPVYQRPLSSRRDPRPCLLLKGHCQTPRRLPSSHPPLRSSGLITSTKRGTPHLALRTTLRQLHKCPKSLKQRIQVPMLLPQRTMRKINAKAAATQCPSISTSGFAHSNYLKSVARRSSTMNSPLPAWTAVVVTMNAWSVIQRNMPRGQRISKFTAISSNLIQLMKE